MHSYMVGSGIRFNDYMFTEPVPLNSWATPKFAGLFVILARDTNWAPKQFQPLCFGEFGNNLRGPLALDSRRLCVNTGPLFISVLAMPFSSSAQRRDARDQLVWAYNPVYQAPGMPAEHELARKLDELEKRHAEQSSQFQLLMANMNRFFEPQPVPPRRSIGFLPDTADSTAC
ncbi:MAG TPA: hypothetical protein VK708_09660 [Bryobacteraceae bacterium]|jgi:hypothetical protein|nr:hypothetical protein [Bryobacteraceae bacterium]